MLRAQKCYLRFSGDMPSDAKGYRSIKDARLAYLRTARELAKYGQSIEASLHFVDVFDGDYAEYPDRVLSLSDRGSIVEQQA